MFIYVLRRALYSLPVLLIATFLVFAMVRATFDPAAKLAQSREAAKQRRELKQELGLDRPLLVQYGSWVSHAASGDFGKSYRTRGDVVKEVRPAFWNTFQLIIWGIIISTIVALFVGVYSGDEAVLTRRLHTHRPGLRGYRDASVLVRTHRDTTSRSSSPTGSTTASRCCTDSDCTRPATPASTGTTQCTSCCRSRR